MNSQEINNKIGKICDKEDFQIAGGKCIPYIGWFWREVDFDSDKCYIGIIPNGFKGFMESNKWGYDGFYVTGDGWDKLKDLLYNVIKCSSKESTKILWDFIQNLEENKSECKK